MKNQKKSLRPPLGVTAQSRRIIFNATRSFLLIGVLIASNVFVLTTPLFAAKVQTAQEYCDKYTTSLLRNACSDGINAEEYCEDYKLSPDTAAYGICTSATVDRNNNLVTKGLVTPVKVTTPDTSSGTDDTKGSDASSGSGLDKIQELLDSTQSLSDYLDILHKSGPDAGVKTDEIADNTKGEYINGAGKKQKLETIHEGTGNSPAILFFNGGGWHANDQTGQRLGQGEGGVVKPSDKGYAMYDVTYRLGSSGVYYMFEDVMRGIKHMRENAKLYGIDPEKIVIWGDSAGGSLVSRAAASGKSGAKAVVGWSPPTNAYTGLFHSIATFAIGVDHSTCAPTDLAGFANFLDLANGGSGDVAEYGQGLSANDPSAIGIQLGGSGGPFSGNIDPLTLMSQGLIAGKNLMSAASDMESITNSITNGGGMSTLGASAFNMAGKKFTECLDNFNALSPALFASPDTPPGFFAGFENDGVVGTEQVYGMRDKLRQLGVKSEALILPVTDECKKTSPDIFGSGCHLGYFPDFVCETMKFVDSVIMPDTGGVDCATGLTDTQGSGECTARVKIDSEINPRNVQSAVLSRAVSPPNPVPSIDKGKTRIDGADSDTGSSLQIGTRAGTKINDSKGGINKPSSSDKYADPARNLNEREDAAAQKDTGNGNNSSNSGGSGGGSNCPDGSGSTPAGGTPSASTPPTGGDNQQSANNGTKKPDEQKQANNQGGKGGGFGSDNTDTDDTNATPSPSPSPTTAPQPGNSADFTGSRSSNATYTEGKRSGECTIDYSRAPDLKLKVEPLVDFCGQQLAAIAAQTSERYNKSPVQLVVTPDIYDDELTSENNCLSGAVSKMRLKGFAIIREGLIYICKYYYTKTTDINSLKANIIHEATHLTQLYGSGSGANGIKAPLWIVEGVADYVKTKLGYDGTPKCSSTSTYIDGYMCGASLFNFIERQYKQEGLVKRVHTIANEGKYTDSVVTKGTNKTLSQLYAECLEAECKGGKSL